MAKIHDKVDATHFATETRLTFDEVVAAAEDAAERSAGIVTKVQRQQADRDTGRIAYQVRRAGVMVVGSFDVVYSGNGNESGNATVAFVPGTFLVSRPAVWFIPIGPGDSAALTPFRTFSKLLKQSVSSAVAA